MRKALSLSRGALGTAVASAVDSLFDGEAIEIRPERDEFAFASAIGITGTHNATVVVRVNAAAARYSGAAMFGLVETDVTDRDMTDAVLEVTNVLGGAAKTAVHGENTLTLPISIPLEATDDDVRKG